MIILDFFIACLQYLIQWITYLFENIYKYRLFAVISTLFFILIEYLIISEAEYGFFCYFILFLAYLMILQLGLLMSIFFKNMFASYQKEEKSKCVQSVQQNVQIIVEEKNLKKRRP